MNNMSSDLLKDLQEFVGTKGNATEFYYKLCMIHSTCHTYIGQWEKLSEESDLIQDIINIVCRIEANFQLNGLGIWLFNKIVSHHINNKTVCDFFSNVDVLEDLIRIGLEHPSHDKCFFLLLKLCGSEYVPFKTIYDIST